VDEAGLVVTGRSADGVTFRLDLGAVGLPEARLPDVAAAIAPIRAWSVDADSDGTEDLGRFLLATVYEPGRYYAITGACGTLGEWRAARGDAAPLLYAVAQSLLTDGERRVELNDPGEPPVGDQPLEDAAARVIRLAFLAAEGEGSLAEGSFAASEFETVDLMPNGQQRFAVYDADGTLRAAAAETIAGQPGKCMWCHEDHVQRGSAENPSAPGYLDYASFAEKVDAAEAWMAVVRGEDPVVDYGTYAVHEHAERLTGAFLEPSPDRVAREWGVSVEEVLAEGLPTHASAEFPNLGPLFDRADVDAARMRREPGWSPFDAAPSDRELAADRPLVGAEHPAGTPGAGPDPG
jgi:hypothetical protein